MGAILTGLAIAVAILAVGADLFNALLRIAKALEKLAGIEKSKGENK